MTRRPRHAEAFETLAETIAPGRPGARFWARRARGRRSRRACSTASSATSGRSRSSCSTSAPMCASRSSRRRRRSIPRCGRWPRLAGFLDRPRGGAGDDAARAGHDPVHRRDRERARRRGLFGVRRRQARAAGAGAERRARTRAEGHPCRACRDRRHDRRAFFARSCPTPPKISRARRFSSPTRSPGTTSGCTGRGAAPGLSKWTCRPFCGDLVRQRKLSSSCSISPAPTAVSPIARCRRCSRAPGATGDQPLSARRHLQGDRQSIAPAIAYRDQRQIRLREAGNSPLHRQARPDKFRMNPHFPVNLADADARLRRRARGGAGPAYLEVGLMGMWEEGLNLADPAVLAHALDRAGLDGRGLLARRRREPVKPRWPRRRRRRWRAACSACRRFSSAKRCSSARSGSGRSRRRSAQTACKRS